MGYPSDDTFEAARERRAPPSYESAPPAARDGEAPAYFDIVFDGPNGPQGPRLVEVEDERGAGISIGEWVHRPDGFWVLRIPRLADLERERAAREAAEQALARAREAIETKINAIRGRPNWVECEDGATTGPWITKGQAVEAARSALSVGSGEGSTGGADGR